MFPGLFSLLRNSPSATSPSAGNTYGCYSHGTCTSNGNCLCYSDNTEGYWKNANCNACITNGNGVLGNGTGYYTGPSCLACSPNYFPPVGNTDQCTKYCSNSSTDPSEGNSYGCSSHGTCDSNGNCACFTDNSKGYWENSNCNACLQKGSGVLGNGGGYYTGGSCNACLLNFFPPRTKYGSMYGPMYE